MSVSAIYCDKMNHLLIGHIEACHHGCIERDKVTPFPEVIKHISIEGDGSGLPREEMIPQYYKQIIDVCGLKAWEWFERRVFEKRVEDDCCDKNILIRIRPSSFKAVQDGVASNFITITVVP